MTWRSRTEEKHNGHFSKGGMPVVYLSLIDYSAEAESSEAEIGVPKEGAAC